MWSLVPGRCPGRPWLLQCGSEYTSFLVRWKSSRGTLRDNHGGPPRLCRRVCCKYCLACRIWFSISSQDPTVLHSSAAAASHIVNLAWPAFVTMPSGRFAKKIVTSWSRGKGSPLLSTVANSAILCCSVLPSDLSYSRDYFVARGPAGNLSSFPVAERFPGIK